MGTRLSQVLDPV